MGQRSLLPRSVIVGGQLVVTIAVLLVTLAVAYVLFFWYPASFLELVGILLIIALGILGIRVGGTVANILFPGYNVAEVPVEGVITRDGGAMPLSPPGQPTADEIVDQIDRANADDAAQALMLKLNTPGGEVVPSDDIRAAADRFDGPTIAYTTDICASGGYWIASGCDAIWAREASIVGSIGVRGSMLNIAELTDRLGISHERFTAGEYKDAGSPFREMTAEERDYLQTLIDDHYDRFIDRVSEGRDLDPADIRETEARIYLGTDAHELGLVDEIGDREDVEAALAERLDIDAVRTQEFLPPRPLSLRIKTGIEHVAFAIGAGFASRLGASEVQLPRKL